MTEKKPVSQMLISYVPGEECRVAMVEDGKLEEFHAERASSISRVGNIYVGTVTNVEPSIQAAFDALKQRHDVQWLVELTVATNYYGFLSGVVSAFEVPPPPDGDKLPT